jgi:hypothetical protein
LTAIPPKTLRTAMASDVLGKATRDDGPRSDSDGEQTIVHNGGHPRASIRVGPLSGWAAFTRLLTHVLIPRRRSLPLARVMTCSMRATPQRRGRVIGVSACQVSTSAGSACAALGRRRHPFEPQLEVQQASSGPAASHELERGRRGRCVSLATPWLIRKK